jgi:hypothetical protein
MGVVLLGARKMVAVEIEMDVGLEVEKSKVELMRCDATQRIAGRCT